MQNQKTEPVEIDISDLPALSPQEQIFVEALGQGDDNCAAYRKAYNASGYSAPALRVRACRKAAEPQIQKHLDALRAVGFASARLTMEARLEEELAFAKRAELAGNFGAAGGAHDRINKLMGLYVERIEATTKHDPLAALKEIATLSPDIAQQLAIQHGINWHSDKPETRVN